jgi:hypothetical protein
MEAQLAYKMQLIIRARLSCAVANKENVDQSNKENYWS